MTELHGACVTSAHSTAVPRYPETSASCPQAFIGRGCVRSFFLGPPIILRCCWRLHSAYDLIMANSKDLGEQTIAMIIALKEGGKKTKEISEQVGVAKSTVRKWCARFRSDPDKQLPVTKPRSGRPRKTSNRASNVLKRTLETRPRVTARAVKEENPQVFGGVSVRTVSRRVHELGYVSHKPVQKPLVTAKQKVKRVAFAKKYAAWSEDDWLNVLWSDEATFSVTCNRGGRVYRRKGSDPLDPRYVESTVKYPDTIMVWGCFSGKGLGSLVVLPKNIRVNQNIYLELLSDHLPDSFEKTGATVFQQDGAPCHKAKSISTWLNDCGVSFIKDWPGNSPDVNPIENLWHIIKTKLQGVDVSSVPKLEAAIRQVWDNLDPTYLHNLAASLPRRLEAVLKRKGLPTKY